jgi:hypothetical protein
MYALDSKTDDGVAETGVFRSDAAGNCAGKYTATDESLICTVVAVIGN